MDLLVSMMTKGGSSGTQVGRKRATSDEEGKNFSEEEENRSLSRRKKRINNNIRSIFY